MKPLETRISPVISAQAARTGPPPSGGPGKPGVPAPKTGGTKKLWWAVIAVGVLLVLGVGTWAVRAARSNSNMAKVQELGRELMGENGRNLSPEERREKFNEMRQAMEQLSPAERRSLFKEGAKARREHMDKFFKMSPEEQIDELDKRIDQMQEMFERMQAGQGENGRPRGGPGGFGGGGFGGPGGGRFGRGRSADPDDRLRWRERMLNNSTPEDRAQGALYRQMMRDRMQERGISFGFGFGRGGR